MKRIKLATNAPEFSRMVYGTWRLLDTKSTPQEINRRLHACLDLGITTIACRVACTEEKFCKARVNRS